MQKNDTYPPIPDGSYWQGLGYNHCAGDRQSPIDINTTHSQAIEEDFSNFTFSVGYKIVHTGQLYNAGGHTSKRHFPLTSTKARAQRH